MYYTVYKITNIINNMTYIGIHRTNDLQDGYMGSGVLLKKAWKKYGRENFKKEILQKCESVDEMFEMESQLVTKDFVKKKNNYNTMVGGPGGPKKAKETDYYNSGEHTTNVLAARELALVACKKKKDKRIKDYYKNPKTCKQCDGPLDYEKKRNKFCSKSCAASCNNKGRVITEEQKRKTSKTMLAKKAYRV